MTQQPYVDFPKRPVKVLKSGAPSSLASYLFALILVAIGAFFLWSQGPGIWRDLQIMRDPVVVEDATMRNAVCKVRKGIFHDCKADISYRVDQTAYRYSVELAFVTIHSGDWTAEVVRSGAHPELVTLDVGLDMLWNRIAVLVVLVLLMLGSGGALVQLGRKNQRTNAMQGRTAEFLGLPATVKGERTLFGKTIINFTCHLNGKALNFVSSFKKNEAPFYLAGQDGTALAILPANAAVPILLDQSLSRVDLTQAEREDLQRLAGA